MAATAEVVRRVVSTGEMDDVLAISDAKDIPYKMFSLPLYNDEPIIVSLWAKAESSMRIRVNVLGKYLSADLTTEWTKLEFKNDSPDSIDFSITALSNTTYYIYKGMIESGATISSDWVEAIEDSSESDAIVRRIIKIDADGLHVKSARLEDSGEWTTLDSEVRIDEDSVDVVVSGTIYSQFGKNYVQFGDYQIRRTSDGGISFRKV